MQPNFRFFAILIALTNVAQAHDSSDAIKNFNDFEKGVFLAETVLQDSHLWTIRVESAGETVVLSKSNNNKYRKYTVSLIKNVGWRSQDAVLFKGQRLEIKKWDLPIRAYSRDIHKFTVWRGVQVSRGSDLIIGFAQKGKEVQILFANSANKPEEHKPFQRLASLGRAVSQENATDLMRSLSKWDKNSLYLGFFFTVIKANKKLNAQDKIVALLELLRKTGDFELYKIINGSFLWEIPQAKASSKKLVIDHLTALCSAKELERTIYGLRSIGALIQRKSFKDVQTFLQDRHYVAISHALEKARKGMSKSGIELEFRNLEKYLNSTRKE